MTSSMRQIHHHEDIAMIARVMEVYELGTVTTITGARAVLFPGDDALARAWKPSRVLTPQS